MENALYPLVGGLAGTLAMTVILLLPRWLNFGNVDVIRAVGTLMTGKLENAWAPGIAVHVASGILFAYVYWIGFGLAGIPLNFMTGAFAGLVHGAIVMLLTSIVVMEHHPFRRYHERGPMTGVMQMLAHVGYGLVVGGVVQILGGDGAVLG